jgi:hypothetical protein
VNSVLLLNAMVLKPEQAVTSRRIERVGPEEEPCDQAPWEKENDGDCYQERRFPPSSGVDHARPDGEGEDNEQKDAGEENRQTA